MIFSDERKQLESTARTFPFRGKEDTPAPYGEVHQARFDLFMSEEQSISRARHFQPFLDTREDRLRELAGPDLAKAHQGLYLRRRQEEVRRMQRLIEDGEIEVEMDGMEVIDVIAHTPAGLMFLDPSGRADIQTIAQIEAVRRNNPDVISDEAMSEQVALLAAAIREQANAVLSRSQGVAGFVAELTGAATAALIDPPIALSMPLGAKAALGRGLIGNALRAFATEAAIVAAVEIPVQAMVFDFKQEIESPWSMKEAAFNVLAASLGAGAIRGAGSLAIDAAGRAGSEAAFQARRQATVDADATRRILAEYEEAVETGRIERTDETERAARELEDFADIEEQARIDSETHHAATTKARLDAQDGRPTDTATVTGETVQVPGGRAATPDSLSVIDPDGIRVDAETFQFKARTDDEGVSDRLRGVERFDQMLSGVTIVYEDLAGTRFIVDGHQRLALAKRAREAGQAADETRLTAFILREAEGVTRSQARQAAAIKNIAEGTGSAIDAAKVLREVGEAGMNMLPPLPPNSALVRGARGLAKLEDEPFQAAINEVVPEQFAAIVGERIQGGPQQMAVLRLLSQVGPANQNQARMIVEQARVAGFETRTTTDLFGEQEIADSFYKERAQVLDAAMKAIRRDRSAFQTAVERGSTLEEAGNVLDQAANAARLEADTEILGAIAALANRAGPISDALTAAAREVRDGTRPAGAATRFLDALRANGLRDSPARRPTGQPGRAAERITADPQVGRVTPIKMLDPEEANAAREMLRATQQGRSLDEIFDGAEQLQRAIVEEGERIASEIDGVRFKNPGVKARATAEDKLARKGLDPDQLTDIARAGFEIDTPQLGDELVARLARSLEIVDEGLEVTPLGYSDRKLLVRTSEGTIGEIQLWAPRLFDAKMNQGGQDLYTQARALIRDGDVIPGRKAEFDELQRRSLELYGNAIAEESDAWVRVTIESMPPDEASALLQASPKLRTRASNISSETAGSFISSTGERGLQPAPGSRITQPETRPSGDSITTPGRPSDLTRARTEPSGSDITSPPDTSIPSQRSIIERSLFDADTRALDGVSGRASELDAPTRLDAFEEAELARIINEEGRFLELPEEIVMVDGELIARGRPVNEVFADLQAARRGLDDVELCAFPRSPS